MPSVELPFASPTVAVTCYLTFFSPVFSKAGSTECFLPAFGSMDCKEACWSSGDLTQGRRSFFFLEKTQAGAWLVDWNRQNDEWPQETWG